MQRKERGRTLVGGSPYSVSLCLDFFATFLKKGSAKNFPEGKAFAHIVRSTVVRDDFVDFLIFRYLF